jgi:acetyl-CoA acetyltransferase
MGAHDVAILGVGMHPWGKWGRNFVEYGIVAAHAALADAGIDWADVDFVAGADTIRNGYPGFIAGATFSQALGWKGNRVSSCYAACASGAQAMHIARSQLLAGFCDVAMVIGADTTPKGFFAPVGGNRPDDPDWQRFRLLGATNPTYFALYARRRMEVYGATTADFAAVKVKNSRHGLENPNARYRKEVTVDDVMNSAVVADPLRLLDICATSDGAAAVILATPQAAARFGHKGGARLAAVSTVTPTFPQTVIELPNFSTDSAVVDGAGSLPFRQAIAHAAYEEAGLGPDDLDLAEVYDLSTALELDWYEDIGLCGEGEAESLVRAGATSVGGRIPVNPSGGLACFGEAIPAQAGARQVEGAKVGIAVNQGLFGHGSGIIVTR